MHHNNCFIIHSKKFDKLDSDFTVIYETLSKDKKHFRLKQQNKDIKTVNASFFTSTRNYIVLKFQRSWI